jgi:ABC-type lipoprotein release transport system permease subunit
VGIPLALVVARVLSHRLNGVTSPSTPMVALVALIVGFVTLLATTPPARRASRVDPLTAMRAD